MALHTLDTDGMMGWTCGLCGKEHSVHHSHDEVQHVSEQIVQLPRCVCGGQTHLAVSFPGPVAQGSEETASRHMQLAQHLRDAGKGPETVRRSEPMPTPLRAEVTVQIEDMVKRMLQEQRSDDTSPRLRSVGPAVTLDADGTANWTCPACKAPQSRSIRNGQFAWDGPDAISMPVCSACGNRAQVVARQHSELSKKLKDIGKGPQS